MATKKKQTKSKAIVGYGIMLDMEEGDLPDACTVDFDSYAEARVWVDANLEEAEDFTIYKITIEPLVKVRKVVNLISIEEAL